MKRTNDMTYRYLKSTQAICLQIEGENLKQLRHWYKEQNWNELFSFFSQTPHAKSLFDLQHLPEHQLYVRLIQKYSLQIKKNISFSSFLKAELGINKPHLHRWQENNWSLCYLNNRAIPEKTRQKVSQSLDLLKTCLPELFSVFQSFTHTLIPITDKNLVSYSLQTLPGISFINFIHRDEIDNVDDLLHENGHHFLNAFLRIKPLFDETSEDLFFSPWRRSLRPLRGIFHGYGTFFWAFNLFAQLSLILHENPNSLPLWVRPYKSKIFRRAFEESLMMDFAFDSLSLASRHDLIYPEGQKLIRVIHQCHQQMKSKIRFLKGNLSSKDLAHLNKLEGDILGQKSSRI